MRIPWPRRRNTSMVFLEKENQDGLIYHIVDQPVANRLLVDRLVMDRPVGDWAGATPPLRGTSKAPYF